MDILIAADNTLPLPVAPFCNLLNGICSVIRFSPAQSRLHIDASELSNPRTYQEHSPAFLNEAGRHDFAICVSAIRYDNNYF